MELEYCKEKFMKKVEERLLDFTFNVYRKGSEGTIYEKGKYHIDARYMQENKGMWLNLDCGRRNALTIWCIDEIKNGVKNPYRFKITIENFVKYFDSFSSLPRSIREDYDFFATRFYKAIGVICAKYGFRIDSHCGNNNISFNLYCNCIDKDTFNKEVDRLYGIIEEILVQVNRQTLNDYEEKVKLEKDTLTMFKEQAENDKNLKPKAVSYSCYKNNKNELVIMKGSKVVATISDCPSDTRVMNALANDVLYDLGYIKEDYF